jgi:hypothetical protein
MAALIKGINESLKRRLKRIIFEEDSKLNIDHLNGLNQTPHGNQIDWTESSLENFTQVHPCKKIS